MIGLRVNVILGIPLMFFCQTYIRANRTGQTNPRPVIIQERIEEIMKFFLELEEYISL